MTVDGKKVIVFGGSAGIGFATAKAFDEAGALVTIAARNGEKLAAACAKLSAKASEVVADTADAASVEAALRAGFDIAIVSAAPPVAFGPLTSVGPDGIATSLNGKALAQAQATLLAAQHVTQGGAVVVVTGVAGRKPMSNMGTIGMANASIEAMVPVLAAEVGPTRVNAVSPGLTATSAYDGMPAEARDGMFAQAAASLPARRVGQPEDLAGAIFAIATNPFITGTVLEVDGGAGLG